MPVAFDTEHLRGQVPDLVGQLRLPNAGSNHAAALDLGEQLRRLILGIEEHLGPEILVRDSHSFDATTAMEP